MTEKAFKTIRQPITFCWNDVAFGYKINGEIKILYVDRLDKGTSDVNSQYGQEQFSAKEFESDEYPSYIVTIKYSNPAQITINYTRFGGYAYSFYTNDLPEIKIKLPSQLKNLNDTLNRGLIEQQKGSLVKGAQEAICPINIKKYLEKNIPSIKKCNAALTINFNVLPNGTVEYTKDINDIGYQYAIKCHLDNLYDKIYKCLENMPKWNMPDNCNSPIFCIVSLDYEK